MKQHKSISGYIISYFCFKSCLSEDSNKVDCYEAVYKPKDHPVDLFSSNSPIITTDLAEPIPRLSSKFSLYLHPDQPESSVPPFPGCPQVKPSYKPAELPVYTTDLIQLTEQKLGKLVYPKENSNENNENVAKGPTMMENRVIYIGEWNSSGEKHGKGIQIWPDGSKYEGEWVNNKTNGFGRLIHANGDYYEGNWAEDKASGLGIYVHANGIKYEGDWKEDQQHGQGKEIWPDGAYYEGSYKAGSKCGQGKFTWADGSSFVGEFLNNDIHGSGIYLWHDGRKYIGEWKFNKMHGKGEFYWPDKRSYVGDYLDGKKHGFGVFSWSNGKKYEGMWENGKQLTEGNAPDLLWKRNKESGLVN